MAEDSVAQERRDFYVYVLFRPNGIPCYVGKGSGQRWRRRDRHKRNPHLGHIIRLAGADLPAVIVRDGLAEHEAFDTEQAFIAAIGREPSGPLVNLSDGGEGPSGAVKDAEWRRNRSEKAKASWQDPIHRALQIERKLGNQNSKKPHKLSPAWMAELTEKMKGNTNSLGVRHPAEFKAAVSLRFSGAKWWHTPEGARYRAAQKKAPEDMPGKNPPKPRVAKRIGRPRTRPAPVEKNCMCCGEAWTPYLASAVCCSVSCANRYRKVAAV